MEETLDAFAGLIKQGKVRAIGASNYTAERLTQALEISRRLGLPRYECLQPHYNLSRITHRIIDKRASGSRQVAAE
jgi:aryl-alcohol dehydrogenase-like predicted oxidoreductase